MFERKLANKITATIVAASMCIGGSVQVFASETVNSDTTVNTDDADEIVLDNKVSEDTQIDTNEAYTLLKARYRTISPAVRRFLADNGVQIQLVDQATVNQVRTSLGLEAGESGVWVKDLKLIQVSASFPLAGLAHEVGHALGDLLAASLADGVDEMYATEAESLTLTGAVGKIDSIEEFFAEAFNVYTVNPKTLQENCPLAYAYVKAIIEQTALKKNEVMIGEDGIAEIVGGYTDGSETTGQPTPESLGTTWQTYNVAEILKLSYINASKEAQQTPWCENNIKSVFSAFLSMPSNVIRSFMLSGWTFEIVTGNELQDVYDEYMSGTSADGVNSAIFIGLHKIYIRNEAASGAENTKYIMAYYIDQLYREQNDYVGATETDTFTEIFNEEAAANIDREASGAAAKYFADSVDAYLNDSANFLKSKPKTAAYVAAALQAVSESEASLSNLLVLYQTQSGVTAPTDQTAKGEETTKEEEIIDDNDEMANQNVTNIAATEATAASSDSSETVAIGETINLNGVVNIGYDPSLVTEEEDRVKIADVTATWALVPENIQKYLGVRGVGIVMEPSLCIALRASMINGEGEISSNFVGLYDPASKAAIVSYDTPEVEVCHEIGHALDDFTKASSSSDFKTIFAAEKNLMQPLAAQNYQNSEQEYFAEAFNLYCVNKEQLRTSAPQTYTYVEGIVASIN